MRIRSALACCLLVGAPAPCALAAQETLPEAAMDALLRYAAGEYVDAAHPVLAVDLDGFADVEVAAAVAARLGLPSGPRSAFYRCDEGRIRCRIEGADRLLRMERIVQRAEGGVLTVRILLGTESEGPEGRARVFPSLREIRMENRGGWTVTSDEVLVIG